MISRRVLRQLGLVDWDFPADLPGTTQALHWYPGTFPSQLPATLIQALSRPSQIIFDPFGGIGTAAGEAIRLGRKAWLVDNNLVGVLVSHMKCGLLLLKASNPLLLDQLFSGVRAVVQDLRQNPSLSLGLEASNVPGDAVDAELARLVRPRPVDFYARLTGASPNWDALSVWIEHETLHELVSLRKKVLESELGYFGRLLGLTMLSAILRPASSQTRSWGHIADNVFPREYAQKDVLGLCTRWLLRTQNVIARTTLEKPLDSKERLSIHAWITLHDWASDDRPIPRPRFGPCLLITSPPYGGAIDYTLAQRLSLYFLGLKDADIKSLCHREIGARRKRFNANSQQAWADELANALSKQLSVLNGTSLVALVLPQKDAGRETGANGVAELMRGAGWGPVLRIDRSIRQSRTRQSWTSIKQEGIHVYAREGLGETRG